MPVLSVLAYKVRAAVIGVVGALMFIIPAALGPPGALGGGAGLDHHQATAVRPPASTRVVRERGAVLGRLHGPGACTAGGNFQAAGRQIEPMVATQSHGRWSRGIPLALPAGAATQPYAQVNGIACRSAGNCVAVGDAVDLGVRLVAAPAGSARGVPRDQQPLGLGGDHRLDLPPSALEVTARCARPMGRAGDRGQARARGPRACSRAAGPPWPRDGQDRHRQPVPPESRVLPDDEHERANESDDRGADFVRKHGQNRHGFPTNAGKTRQDKTEPRP